VKGISEHFLSEQDSVLDNDMPDFVGPPRRVVSLVPSTTESLFELGLGEAVVGITTFCIYPEGRLDGLPRLGGPKNPDIAAIRDLQPDLALANHEENTRQAIEAIQEAGIPVWVSFPRSVAQAIEFLLQLAAIFQDEAAEGRVKSLAAGVEQTRRLMMEKKRTRYFCPIWKDRTAAGLPWWMTFNRETYSHDLLDLLGGENIFRDRERRYPLEADLGLAKPQEATGRDRRYPRVVFEEIAAAKPEVVLLPSEPYAFEETDQREFEELFPAIHLNRIDGSLLTWHGTRLGRALRELAGLF
jgi:ABC-type Fe3+-hydroxamate transport system substrate-binding protein